MGLSQIAREIPEPATLAVNEKAKLLRDKGDDIIHLGAGEPKNRAPIHALLTSAARLNEGDIKYAPSDGLPSLKKAIVRFTEELYGRRPEPEQIIVSNGAKQAVYNLLFALLDEETEVIIIAPYWVSYPWMVRMRYARPVIVTPEDGGFVPRLQEIEEMVGSYTRAIIINSPNNPSGVMYPESLISDLVDFCERKGIYLIMDDIYNKLVFDGKQPISAYKYTNKSIEETKVVTVNGVSKLYGMTGFRVGWAVGNKELIEACTRIQSQITTCTSTILQAAAEGALNGLQSVVESLRLMLENNRNVMMQELQAFDGVRVIKPDGTYYCLPDFSAYDKDSVRLCNFLLDKALVAAVPGKDFGMEGYLRLSYATTVKDIKEGIERIKWALDPNSPNEIYIGDRKLMRDWL